MYFPTTASPLYRYTPDGMSRGDHPLLCRESGARAAIQAIDGQPLKARLESAGLAVALDSRLFQPGCRLTISARPPSLIEDMNFVVLSRINIFLNARFLCILNRNFKKRAGCAV